MSCIPISQLNLESQRVKCPACQHVGDSVRIMEVISNKKATTSGLFACYACLLCNCSGILAPTYYFISHYCSGCGIRFVVVPWYQDPILHLNESTLLGQPGHKVAPSPVGPPPQFNEATLRNFAERLLTMSPSLVLNIFPEENFKFPGTVFDESGTKQLYSIIWPGVPAGQGTVPSPIEYVLAEPMTTNPETIKMKSMAPWDPSKSTPHIRVLDMNSGTGEEVATAQVFPTSRDYILHTPHRGPDGSIIYTSRRTGIRSLASPMAGFMIWNSCRGPLTWMIRSVHDPENNKICRRIVLMDAYDRPVGILCLSNKESATKLTLYGNADPVFVAECLASYAAIIYVIWNYSQLTDGREGWEVLDAGLNVAGSAMGLAGV